MRLLVLAGQLGYGLVPGLAMVMRGLEWLGSVPLEPQGQGFGEQGPPEVAGMIG